ncbi:choice-of-anchor O protein [Pseudomonadota bacterium]
MKNHPPKHESWLLPLGAITLAVSSALMVGCSSSSSSGGGTTSVPTVEEPAPLALEGTALACDTDDAVDDSTIASGLLVEEPNSIPGYTVSKDAFGSESKANAGQNIKRLTAVVPGITTGGLTTNKDGIELGDVHPILVTYTEQVIGDYSVGEGSADIGDPTHIDDPFASLSLDEGETWKKVQLADTSGDSSIAVNWNGFSTSYKGHSHKSTNAVNGNNILVAWNDKYCPSANPFGLTKDEDNAEVPYPDDLYKVNGSQGSIDYAGEPDPIDEEPLYEVPFSCVWTARGVFVDDIDGNGETGDYGIEWRKAQQLTSGTRDSNKIWIASAPVGFALTWQEDPEGLRSGKGAGPGEGYSGATTNHGADIWYTHIPMEGFNDVCVDADGADDTMNTEDDCLDVITGEEEGDIQLVANLETKPVPAVNFEYPVRISNNEVCAPDDNKIYCTAETEVVIPDTDPVETELLALNCIDTVSFETGSSGNPQSVSRCVQADLDYMTPDSTIEPANAVLDGDTGASRPALKLLKTDAVFEDDPATLDVDESLNEEYVAILAYEETKGLSESDPGTGIPNDGETVDTVNIALEGKAVYFESFLWDQPVTVSAGRPVNLRVPEVTITQDDITKAIIVGDETGLDIYENARRVVIASQVDSCDADTVDEITGKSVNPTFAIMYKQGYDVQGGPADMYIRRNYGFTYEDFETEVVGEEEVGVAFNVSARTVTYGDAGTEDEGKVTMYEWEEANLLDQSYTSPEDNTFSPRVLLRGAEIYTGFEYSPSWRMTNQGTVPNNFWIHTYLDPLGGDALAWQGPKQISMTTGSHVSTLDPRFATTPKGRADATAAATALLSNDADLIESDTSNPNVLFLSYGTFDMDTHEELDLHYLRSTDRGASWEYYDSNDIMVLIDDHGADGIFGTDDDPVQDFSVPKLAHGGGAADVVHDMEVQSLASPNGATLYNVYNSETSTDCADEWCGLETMSKRADYDFDPSAL